MAEQPPGGTVSESSPPSGQEDAAAPERPTPVLAHPLLEETPGRYELRTELARGGQGVVYVAYDHHLHREVAFKVLRASGLNSDPGDVERRADRFVREAWVTAGLEHPGIAPVHEVGRRADGTCFVTQKLVRGRTLARALEACGTPQERFGLLPAYLGVCQAVAFAHQRGVVHRDLKPANIMVGPLGEAVVIDWGLARTRGAPAAEAPRGEAAPDLPERTRDGARMGTSLYMSPEQVDPGTAEVGVRSDVWALGVILYEVLTGARPFEGARNDEVYAAVRRGPPAPLRDRCPEVPPDLAAVVDRALRTDPAERYADAGALAAEVSRYLAGDRVVAYEYRSWELAARLARRNPLAGTLAALLLLGLLGGGLVLRQRYAESRRLLAESYLGRGQVASDALQWDEAAVWFAAARVQEDTWRARAHLAYARQQAPRLVGVRALPGLNFTDVCALEDGGILAAGTTSGGVEVRDLPGGQTRLRVPIRDPVTVACSAALGLLGVEARTPDGGALVQRFRLADGAPEGAPAELPGELPGLWFSSQGGYLLASDLMIESSTYASGARGPLAFVRLTAQMAQRPAGPPELLAWVGAQRSLWSWKAGEAKATRGPPVAMAQEVRPEGDGGLLVSTASGLLELVPREAIGVAGHQARAPGGSLWQLRSHGEWRSAHGADGALVLVRALPSGELFPVAVLKREPAFQRSIALTTGHLLSWTPNAAGSQVAIWEYPRGGEDPGTPLTGPGSYAALAPRGHRLALGLRGGGGRTRVLDFPGGGVVAELASFARCSMRQLLSFSEDGARLAVAEAASVAVYDLRSTPPRRLLSVPGAGMPPVALSPDGALLVTNPTEDQELLEAWEVDTGRRRWSARGRSGRSVAFSPDSRVVTLGTEQDLPNRLVSLDALSGRGVEELALDEGEVFSLARSSGGVLAAAGDQVWRVDPGQAPVKLRSAGGHHFSVALSDDGAWLAAASWDRVRLWRRGELRPTLEFPEEGTGYLVGFSPDGTVLYHGGARVRAFTLAPRESRPPEEELDEVQASYQLDFDGQEVTPRPLAPMTRE